MQSVDKHLRQRLICVQRYEGQLQLQTDAPGKQFGRSIQHLRFEALRVDLDEHIVSAFRIERGRTVQR